jgi:hypothetical protein
MEAALSSHVKPDRLEGERSCRLHHRRADALSGPHPALRATFSQQSREKGKVCERFGRIETLD